MQARIFSLGSGDISIASKGVLKVKGTTLVLKFAQEAIKIYINSNSTVVVGWCRRIARSMSRLVGTNIEIIGASMMLPSLERLGKEQKHWLHKSRIC